MALVFDKDIALHTFEMALLERAFLKKFGDGKLSFIRDTLSKTEAYEHVFKVLVEDEDSQVAKALAKH